jgi:hypothetical protein
VVAGAALAGATTDIGAWQLGHAVELSWPGAVISHQLAGNLWGFPVEHGGIGTAIVAPDRGLTAYGLRAHRTKVADWDIGALGGLTVTTPARTAVDLLATLRWADARDLWAWVSTHGWLDLNALEEAIDRRPARTGPERPNCGASSRSARADRSVPPRISCTRSCARPGSAGGEPTSGFGSAVAPTSSTLSSKPRWS